jgi:hypothetical protein
VVDGHVLYSRCGRDAGIICLGMSAAGTSQSRVGTQLGIDNAFGEHLPVVIMSQCIKMRKSIEL